MVLCLPGPVYSWFAPRVPVDRVLWFVACGYFVTLACIMAMVRTLQLQSLVAQIIYALYCITHRARLYTHKGTPEDVVATGVHQVVDDALRGLALVLVLVTRWQGQDR